MIRALTVENALAGRLSPGIDAQRGLHWMAFAFAGLTVGFAAAVAALPSCADAAATA